MSRRIDIEADDVPELLDKPGSFDSLKEWTRCGCLGLGHWDRTLLAMTSRQIWFFR